MVDNGDEVVLDDEEYALDVRGFTSRIFTSAPAGT